MNEQTQLQWRHLLQDMQQAELSEVGNALEQVNRSTEDATESILDAAEAVLALASPDHPNAEAIATACMRIIEACNFQDLTGQRIQKALTTITHIESRLKQLKSLIESGAALPASEPRAAAAPKEGRAAEEAAGLLNGPQALGEAPSQNDIDTLFNNANEC